MEIKLTSVLVDNQQQALEFYTGVLGFNKKADIPMGEHRWLTVVSAEGPDDVELVLEPNAFPAAKTFQEALFQAGIPSASFAVVDVADEHQRLSDQGVVFKSCPTDVGATMIAGLNDTCRNWVQIFQR